MAHHLTRGMGFVEKVFGRCGFFSHFTIQTNVYRCSLVKLPLSDLSHPSPQPSLNPALRNVSSVSHCHARIFFNTLLRQYIAIVFHSEIQGLQKIRRKLEHPRVIEAGPWPFKFSVTLDRSFEDFTRTVEGEGWRV